MNRVLPAALLAALLLHLPCPAQDSAPLVRKKADKVKVTVRKKGEKPADAPADSQQQKADRKSVIVGVVNAHRLTGAELDYAVEMKLRGLGGKDVLADREGTIIVLGPDMKPERPETNPELMRDMKDRREATERRLESEVLSEWVAARLLADEARRQGIILDAKEMDAELERSRKNMGMTQRDLDTLLARFGIDAGHFESEVHDALLGKKLVDRFIEANWTDEELRQIYERSPGDFILPTRARMAQYVVAVQGSEKGEELRKLKDRAERVRKKMERDGSLEKILSEETDLERGYFGAADTGWMSLPAETLPQVVQDAALKLSPGSVSAVLTDKGEDGVVLSYQVIKLLERKEGGKAGFEAARPQVRGLLQQPARELLVQRLMEGKTHRIITNLRAVSPDLLPTQEQLTKLAAAAPLPLKFDKAAISPN